MAAPEPMQKLFAAIDNNKVRFIENLRKAVAIKSVSAWPETRPEITTMMKYVTSGASKSSIRRFVITEKAPTRAFSWLSSYYRFHI